MQARGTSLSGDWTGVYDYDQGDDLSAAVPFTAALFDVGGAVWGKTREPNTFAPGHGDELVADVNGFRTGKEVRFRKTYAGAVPGGEMPVDYAGYVTSDGNRVEGQWVIRFPGRVLSGPFVMNRIASARADAERGAIAAAKMWV